MNSLKNFISNKENLKKISPDNNSIFEIEFEGQKYIIKKISKNKVDLNENLEQREYLKRALQNEINIQKKMSGFENSVKLYYNFDDKDDYILVLEFCDSDLNQLLKEKGNFSSKEILSIMKDLNKPLKYMHDNGLIHRDIKPHNIMIKYSDSSKKNFISKIGDYGISRELDKGNATTYAGTEYYMAPEIVLGRSNYNDKSDLFSIGVMMYELYFNSYPFGWTKNNREIEIKYKGKKMKDCEDKILDDLLNQLLIYDPNKRISWEEYLNHPFFKGSNHEKEEHQMINFYDNVFEAMIYQYYIRLKQTSHQELSIEKCLELKNEPFFILGILALYLQKIGISVLIEKDDSPKNLTLTEYNKNVFQIICNSYILKSKYLLDFNLNINRINTLFNNHKERNIFNDKIKIYISKIYNINEAEILITNILRYANVFTAVIVIKSDFNRDITQNELIQVFQRDQELKSLVRVDKELITPIIKLSLSMLFPREDNKENIWSIGEKRGGEDYIPPLNWIKYGIKIDHSFNDKNFDWISYLHKPGEWSVAYCGITGITKKMQQIFKNDNDIKHKGKKVGVGVYCPSDPKIMEEMTETINANGENYKVGFMLRVKPNKIRASKRNKKIWVLDGNDDELRPYGILIKKI